MPPARRLFQSLALGLALFAITRCALAAQPVPPGILWGAGYSPALGIGASARRDEPKEIASGVLQVMAGYSQSFFLKADGILWASGYNAFGQLDDGAALGRSAPLRVANDMAQVGVGYLHSLILYRNGSLWAVGWNSNGQLGNNSTDDSLTPVPVADDVAQVAAGYQHSAFIKSDGTLWVVGGNMGGQLGDGTSTDSALPHLVTGGVRRVSAGTFCTVFIRDDGSLWGMGDWAASIPTELDTGVASVAAASSRILYVKTNGTLWACAGVGSASTQVDSGVVAVALSGWGGAACYLKTDASMWAYGTDGSRRTISGPGIRVASGVVGIASGDGHFLFVKADATLWSFGSNTYGQLGDGASYVQSTPAYVADQVVGAATSGRSSFALKADGTLWGAGANTYGQLGDGTTTDRSKPVQVARDVSAVAAGANHSLFLKADGSLWATGYNESGQLGVGTTTDRRTPVRVASGVTAVAAGDNHSLFLKADGSLWAMGSNGYGQLGDGSIVNRTTAPAQVASGVTAVAAGSSHSLFLKSDATLWAMGLNFAGQLGDGSTTDRSAPVQVAGGVVAMAAGDSHSLFLKADGSLWAMGDNAYGQLGNGTTLSTTAPVLVTTDVVAVAAGRASSLFLKSDATLWGAGYNESGDLGDGTTINQSTPVLLGAGITGIATGGGLFIQQPGFGAAPAITTPPQSAIAARGANCSLSVVASGTGPVGYQWYKAGVAIEGARSAELNFVYTTEADAGSYTVVATNAAGATSASLPAAITLGQLPVITGQPQDVAAAPGATATFSVAATGDGTLGYEWYRNDVIVAGATGPALVVTGVSPADFGAYSVVVFNECGRTSSTPALLTVGSAGGQAYRLLDYFRPLAVGNQWTYVGPDRGADGTHSRVIVEDMAKSITCYDNALPAQPVTEPVVSFEKSFGSLAGGFTAAETWFDYYTVEGGHLVFHGDDQNGGTKQLRLGGGVVLPATLTLGESSWWSGRLIANGSDQGLAHDGVQLEGVESVVVSAGTYVDCLHLHLVTILDDPDIGRVLHSYDEWWAAGIGMVKHHREEAGGWTEDQELLSTNLAAPTAPVFSGSPAGATIASGATATLTVGAAGTAPLSYQWYRGDTASPITGATTASFTTSALTAWARYWVRVSNPYGTADSATALVEVTGGTMTIADWTAQGEGTPDGTLTPAQRAPLATPAGDGVTNLMKFVLGVPPMENAESRLPRPVRITAAGVPVALALDFTVNPHAQGIRYALEVSDNMVTWTEAASITEPRGTNPDGTQLVRLREAAAPVALRHFIRLKVEMVSE